jgi:glycosyltransferase involved in cell wall biosynthesis
MLSDSELIHPRAKWKRVVKKLVLPRIFRRVSGFLTIGDNNEAYLRYYGVAAHKLYRGAYPTDEEVFWKAREQRAALRLSTRQKRRIGLDEFVALFVGKLIPRKRPLDLLQAAIRLSRDPALCPRMTAVFAGDGELRGALERDARASGGACCKFLGFLNQSELPAAYAAADVLVHPAEEDAHPLTITESAMVGLPVIVSNKIGCIGPTDTARPGQNALVYPAGDVGALAHALRTMLMNPHQLAAMEAATLKVARECGLDAAVSGVLKAVQGVVLSKST